MTEVVEEAELRRMFAQGRFEARAETGELACIETYGRPPSPRFRQPANVTSKEYTFYDGGTPVARAHCYEYPDGARAASGKLDPTMVMRGGTMYVKKAPRRKK
jgi:hypothetical protein